MSANAPWQASGGIWGVVATPIPTYGVVAFVKYAGDNSKVYLYRHSAGGGASPPTISLSASPTSVPSGGKSTLTWSSSNANACTASGGWSGSRATSGTEQRTINAHSTFTLTCSNTQGQSASRSVTVSVGAVPPAPTLTFSAWPSKIGRGDNTSLTWNSPNTTGCAASGGWAGNKAVSGTQISALLYSSTAFNLDCTGPGGTISRSVSITVDPALAPRPLVTMALKPWSVTLTPEYCAARGMTPANCTGSTVISWSASNATSCTASEGWSGTRPPSGQMTLSGVANSTIYGIRCTGPGGSRNGAVKFTVIHP
jgi:hypothetical protein